VIDAVPDWDERICEIGMSLTRQLHFKLIRQVVGEKHHQLVDDVFTSHDGRFLYVSRPSFADVARQHWVCVPSDSGGFST